MVTEQDVINFIKRKNRNKVLLPCIILLILPILFALPFFHLEKAPREYIVILIPLGLLIVLTVDGFLYNKLVRPAINEAKDVLKDPIFRSFKTPERLASAYNEAASLPAVYEHNKIRLTEKYVYNTGDYRWIARLADIREISIVRDPYDSEGKALMIVDCHQHSCIFSMSGDREAARHLGELIVRRCPEITKNGLLLPF